MNLSKKLCYLNSFLLVTADDEARKGVNVLKSVDGYLSLSACFLFVVFSLPSRPFEGSLTSLSSSFRRTRPKVQFNGYVGHESSNGQASFENPMYDTNMKPTEAKAVRFDTTLNTVCTVV